ncbi:ABC transporter ATP-binding protein [Candidatus Sumerlaeota bacterium]|nr:ABC transporter ATP-binding protein [Candidatus Sumerlaeota bacterium]
MSASTLRIIGLSKEFRTLRRYVVALRDINLTIREGEFFVVLGPSGCGKSTLLNILAGLEKPTEGEIWFGETLVADAKQKRSLTPKERNVAMVFQSYALYPHLNVFENIAFPLRIAKRPKEEIKKGVLEVARLLAIENLLSAKPKELSGGQRQRVAIARAIIRHPSVFLLDEPLSNLDAQLRVRLREELKNLQRSLGVTTVYVTHDQAEAMTLGDRIAIINQGILQQVGDPMGVYRHPTNTFVARFMGTPPMNLLKAKVLEQSGKVYVKIETMTLKLDETTSRSLSALKSSDVIVGIRPEDIKLAEQASSARMFAASVRFVERLGADFILYVSIGNNKVLIKLHEDPGIKEGDKITFSIDTAKVHIFDLNGRNIRK